jgi:transcriptional regulator with XRE-family HTH domain
MPASSPSTTPESTEALLAIGEAVRRRRKALGLSAVATAEAAGISRPTLHRIEKGEPSVTLGAAWQVLTVLGLSAVVQPRDVVALPAPSRAGWLPARIHIADYPQLQQLAWQVHGPQVLTPREALGIYERNARHLDSATLGPQERDLIDALRLALGDVSAGENGV